MPPLDIAFETAKEAAYIRAKVPQYEIPEREYNSVLIEVVFDTFKALIETCGELPMRVQPRNPWK
jgi:hypothetical protein